MASTSVNLVACNDQQSAMHNVQSMPMCEMNAGCRVHGQVAWVAQIKAGPQAVVKKMKRRSKTLGLGPLDHLQICCMPNQWS